MSRLTVEERRRVFLSQEQARRTMLARLGSAPIAAREPRTPGRHLHRLLKTVTIVMLLGGGWLAYHALEFHPPASIVEALLPRS